MIPGGVACWPAPAATRGESIPPPPRATSAKRPRRSPASRRPENKRLGRWTKRRPAPSPPPHDREAPPATDRGEGPGFSFCRFLFSCLWFVSVFFVVLLCV